ncbi:hypothetical protein VQL36_13770 [Chengkuizengella sp. SCS-71B]|uniref:hypothetical protein n=1 Tax=Chengkuizengella sp. SCS-71B TaxID=3115290 RepID=UPI0032C21E7C
MRLKAKEKMNRRTLKHLEEYQENLNRSRPKLDLFSSKDDMDLWIKQVQHQRKSSIINTIDQLEKRISSTNNFSSVEQLFEIKTELKKLLISLEDKL